MIALRTVIHFITGEPVDRDTRRARLLAAPRKPIGSITRRGILSGHWDQGGRRRRVPWQARLLQ